MSQWTIITMHWQTPSGVLYTMRRACGGWQFEVHDRRLRYQSEIFDRLSAARAGADTYAETNAHTTRRLVS